MSITLSDCVMTISTRMYQNEHKCKMQSTRKVELVLIVAYVSLLAICLNKMFIFLKCEYLMRILISTNMNFIKI